jgi:hypothetical protein
VLVAKFRKTIEPARTGREPVRVAIGAGSRVTDDDICVTVEDGDSPVLRIDLFEAGYDRCHAFEDAIVWHGFVVIGYGGRVHFVSLTSRATRTFMLDGYFGNLFAVADHVLVSDARYLHCFGRDASLLWRSEALGIDGVRVDRVEDGVIEGDAQVELPHFTGHPDDVGRWDRFRLLLASGQPA